MISNIKIGINGFGRLVFRCALEQSIQVIAVNDPSPSIFIPPAEHMVNMLKHDSTHEHFKGEVSHKDNKFIVTGQEISTLVEICNDVKIRQNLIPLSIGAAIAGKAAKYEEIYVAIKEATNGPFKNMLTYTEDEVVSTCFIDDIHSSVFYAKAGISLDDRIVIK
ncbi:unnamed protein product [Rotaria sp. Silwood1]|nr:unnamed protein product [Rotaria sp. Silwood1]CAF3589083.1 unnamed protein product [Rotaria sp. Silwood1]